MESTRTRRMGANDSQTILAVPNLIFYNSVVTHSWMLREKIHALRSTLRHQSKIQFSDLKIISVDLERLMNSICRFLMIG